MYIPYRRIKNLNPLAYFLRTTAKGCGRAEGGAGKSLVFHSLKGGCRQLGQLLWPVLTIGEIHYHILLLRAEAMAA